MNSHLLAVVLFFASGGMLACQFNRGNDNANAIDPRGTYLAKEPNAYVKLVTISGQGSRVEVLSSISHQVPITDFNEGLKTQLAFNNEGGSIEGPWVIGMNIPGGSHSDSGSSLMTGISYEVMSANQVDYVLTLSNADGKTLKSIRGPMMRTDSGSVLGFLKTQVDKYFRLYRSDAMYVHSAFLADINNRCDLHFLNSCDTLIEIGFLKKPADSMSKEKQPEAPKIHPAPVAPPSSQVGEREIPARPARPDHGSLSAPSVPKVVIITPPSTGQQDRPYPYIPLENKVDEQNIVEQATVRCADINDCPESIGLLIGSTGSEVFQCSTTYIGHGYFTTNSHCLPSNLVSFGTYKVNCSGSIWVKMPETSKSRALSLSCEKIIMSTLMDENKDPHESRDVMVFKVKESVPRESAQVNWNKKPEQRSTVTMWAVNPVPDQPGINGMIVRKTCRIYDPRNLSPILKAMDLDYPVSNLRDCTPAIIKGNSGSSVFDHNSESRAIVSHTDADGKGFGLVSNYSCASIQIDSRGLVTDNRRACQWIQNKELPSMRSTANTIRAAKTRIEIQNAIQTLQRLFDRPKVQSENAGVVQPDFQDLSAMFNFSNVRWLIESQTPVDVVYRDSDGDTHNLYLLSGGELADRIEFLTQLPRCIRDPSEWAESNRQDWRYNLFSKRSYRDVNIRLPIRITRDRSFQLNSKQFTSDTISQATVNADRTGLLPVGLEATLMLSNYYNEARKSFKAPVVKLSISSSDPSPEAQQAIRQIKKWVEELRICR